MLVLLHSLVGCVRLTNAVCRIKNSEIDRDRTYSAGALLKLIFYRVAGRMRDQCAILRSKRVKQARGMQWDHDRIRREDVTL